MHELAAAMSIVETALRALQGHSVKRVSRVNVEIGEFTFLVHDQLRFNFEIASQKTILEGAELCITHVPGRLRCDDCGFEGESQPDPTLPSEIAVFAPMKCPNCGSSATVITGGKEFYIRDIEAEIADM